MAEETIIENKKSPKSKVIAKNYVYLMGEKGGLKVEVRQNIEHGDRYLRINKWWQGQGKDNHLILNKERHWTTLKRFVDRDFSRFLGWSGYEIDQLKNGEYISQEEHNRLLKKKDKELKQKTKELQDLHEDIVRVRKSAKKRLMETRKTKIPQYNKELKKFNQLMKESRKERELHNHLRDNPWMFGPKYIVAKSEQRIGFKSRSDFLLQTYDGYYDIVELKKSNNVKIFTRNKFSSVTQQAISQMIGYLHKCDILYSDNRMIFDLDILKPKGIIVIGRAENKEMLEKLRIHNFYLHNIKIITYDELFKTAKKSIEQFEDTP
jgi:hypothetical protein